LKSTTIPMAKKTDHANTPERILAATATWAPPCRFLAFGDSTDGRFRFQGPGR
jgi:hypothetical protein